MASRRNLGRDQSMAIAVEGITGLQRAISRMDASAGKELRGALKDIAEHVRGRAEAGAPVGPRPKRSRTKPLGPSIRASATQRGASVYSNEAHAYVQDRGGQVGRRGLTLLRRSEVSGYMTKAVRNSQLMVSRRLEGLLAEFGREFEK